MLNLILQKYISYKIGPLICFIVLAQICVFQAGRLAMIILLPFKCLLKSNNAHTVDPLYNDSICITNFDVKLNLQGLFRDNFPYCPIKTYIVTSY